MCSNMPWSYEECTHASSKFIFCFSHVIFHTNGNDTYTYVSWCQCMHCIRMSHGANVRTVYVCLMVPMYALYTYVSWCQCTHCIRMSHGANVRTFLLFLKSCLRITHSIYRYRYLLCSSTVHSLHYVLRRNAMISYGQSLF